MSGTVQMKGKDVDERMRQLWQEFKLIAEAQRPDEVHIERMNRRVHRYCLWAAHLTRTIFSIYGSVKVFGEISPGSWKKELARTNTTLQQALEDGAVDSEDEAVAVAMGNWFLQQVKKEKAA